MYYCGDLLSERSNIILSRKDLRRNFRSVGTKITCERIGSTLGQRKEIDLMQVDPNDTLYTIQEAIDYLGISRSTLDNHRSDSYLTNVKKEMLSG